MASPDRSTRRLGHIRWESPERSQQPVHKLPFWVPPEHARNEDIHDQAANQRTYADASRESNRRVYGDEYASRSSNRRVYGDEYASRASNRVIYGDAGRSSNRAVYGDAGRSSNRAVYGDEYASRASNGGVHGNPILGPDGDLWYPYDYRTELIIPPAEYEQRDGPTGSEELNAMRNDLREGARLTIPERAAALLRRYEETRSLNGQQQEKAVRKATSDAELLLLEIEQSATSADAGQLNGEQREALIDIVANELPGGYWTKRKSTIVG